MIKLAVSGAHGRMGSTIAKLAAKDKDFKLTALLEHKDHPKLREPIQGVNVSADNGVLKNAQALIEFTLPEATLENLAACVKYNVKMVIGTTGLNGEQEKKVKAAAKKIAIVYASNMSIGVNTLFKLIQIAGKSLKGIQDIAIGETHHIHKKDAPSGTAKTMFKLAEEAAGGGVRFDEDKIKREGEVIGYHEITFETEFDTLKIIHNAKDRSMFALGALTAVKFLKNKKTGLYTMQDVLGLN
jgi:4-hydroxy-tetrahydrodipicolinate reductase